MTSCHPVNQQVLWRTFSYFKNYYCDRFAFLTDSGEHIRKNHGASWPHYLKGISAGNRPQKAENSRSSHEAGLASRVQGQESHRGLCSQEGPPLRISGLQVPFEILHSLVTEFVLCKCIPMGRWTMH